MESASKDVRFRQFARNKGMYIRVVAWFNIRAVCMVCMIHTGKYVRYVWVICNIFDITTVINSLD